MRIDFRNRTFAWVLLAALALTLSPALHADAAPRGVAAQEAETGLWSSFWSTLHDWLTSPSPDEPAAAQGEGEPETDDGPDMDPDG